MDHIILPSHEYLNTLSIPYETRSFPETTEKGAANVAKVLDLLEEQIIKTLIFEVSETKEKVLIMVPANASAISGHLKKVLGKRDIRMASPEEVLATTGYVIGSIPPFSWQPYGFRTFIDISLMNQGILGVGTGKWGNEILITPENLVKASNAKIVNLIDKDKSIFVENTSSIQEPRIDRSTINTKTMESIDTTKLKPSSEVTTIKEIFKKPDNESVYVQGWLSNKRSSGSIHFLTLRDGTGFIQAVVSKSDVDEATFELIGKSGMESSVQVKGTIHKDDRAPGGSELVLSEFSIVGESKDYPIAKKKHGVNFLLNRRHLWFRSTSQFATLRLRGEIIWALHDFFHKEEFIKFDSPMFTSNEAEGSSTLFEVDYFGKKAFLAQTGQLQGEAGAMAFRKIYTFGPTFRAEKSKTRRHLTEFWMLEPEVAFNDWKDNIALQERMIKHVIRHCLDNCTQELEMLGRDLTKLENGLKPFIWIHHKDACKELQKLGLQIGDRDDLGADEEAVLTKQYDSFIVLHHMPAEIKAFYMQPDLEEGDNRVCCNDLLAPEGYGEVIGGSQRIHDVDLMTQKLIEFGLKPEDYEWYLDLRRYGSVPHAGYGLGLERLVAWIGGLKHIRTTIPFPRMINRLNP